MLQEEALAAKEAPQTGGLDTTETVAALLANTTAALLANTTTALPANTTAAPAADITAAGGAIEADTLVVSIATAAGHAAQNQAEGTSSTCQGQCGARSHG